LNKFTKKSLLTGQKYFSFSGGVRLKGRRNNFVASWKDSVAIPNEEKRSFTLGKNLPIVKGGDNTI